MTLASCLHQPSPSETSGARCDTCPSPSPAPSLPLRDWVDPLFSILQGGDNPAAPTPLTLNTGTSSEQTQPNSAKVMDAPPPMLDEQQRPDPSPAGPPSCSGSGPTRAITHTPSSPAPPRFRSRGTNSAPQPLPKCGPWSPVGQSAEEGREEETSAAATKREGRGRREGTRGPAH